ncbi:S8 family serine peptidase [Deinococcus arcticus]|uniref:Peptidase S8/S53 domain-containing protein n=1 Tax=Deinococcus arcticus TaxID=2136176 RepID=A0A2T3W466_9DEIO|nr:S8 family serine peptidase [Deinococcus arcticus]PTA66584.1 hypothetical protein C8263_16920 [Deinococcus arcticus]
MTTMFPRFSSIALLSATLLVACGPGGGGTPPEPVVPPAVQLPAPPTTPVPAPQYIPAAGWWNGKKAEGPWCAGKPSTQSLGTLTRRAPLAVPTAEMKALSGLSRDLTGPSAQSTGASDLAVLLPTETNASEALEVLKSSGVNVTGEFGYWATIRASNSQAASLVRRGTVQYAEKLPTFKPVGLPEPIDATMRNQNTYLPMMNSQAAWSQLELGCDHPVVAVIDSGWSGSTTHAEHNLVPKNAWLNVIKGEQGNADAMPTKQAEAEHGASVAGVIAMTTNGFGAGAGVSYNLAKVLPISAMDTNGLIWGPAAARGIEYALGSTTINGKTFVNPYPASVINLSFGSDPTLSPSQFFQSFFTAAANKGVVIVAAVGNELSHGTNDTAGLNHSIGAAGVMFDGNRWVDPYQANFGSNHGPGVDVAAPAMAVPSMVDGRDTYWSGTSMSSPWVAAQIVMWMYANQHHRADGSKTLGLKGDALYNKLYACFAAIGSNRGTKDEYLGYGKLDTGRLVSPTETACR